MAGATLFALVQESRPSVLTCRCTLSGVAPDEYFSAMAITSKAVKFRGSIALPTTRNGSGPVNLHIGNPPITRSPVITLVKDFDRFSKCHFCRTPRETLSILGSLSEIVQRQLSIVS